MLKIPGKIPITIQPLFWLFAILIGWLSSMTLTGTVLWLVVILVSILIHEFGHALTAIAFGQKARIELAAFGGFTYREGPRLKLWQEFIVVFNGPLAGLCLCAIAWFVMQTLNIQTSSWQYLLRITVYVNLIWTLLNLTPVLPLDGGHLLSIILESIFGFRGVKIALVVGMIFAIGLSAFFFITGSFLVGAIFLILTFESVRSFRYYRMLSAPDRDTQLQELIKQGQLELQNGNDDAALTKFEEVRKAAQQGILFLIASEHIADIYRKKQRYDEAYGMLKPLQPALNPETLPLFHFLAFVNRDFPMVIKVGNQCFQMKPTYDTALMNAYANAYEAKAEPAVGWLECAVRQGAPSLKDIVNKTEFDPIRHDPLFHNFVNSLH